MVPVLNKPFLKHTIEYLRQFGIEEVILALSYLPDVIREYFGNGDKFDIRLTYCLEKEPLGTAGAVKNAEEYLDTSFIVLNGDIFTDLNIADMLAFHRQKQAEATIALYQVENPGAFGVVETLADKRVTRFLEKPKQGEAPTNWINAGVYILEPSVLRHIPANSHYMFEKSLFPTLINLGEPVYGYPYSGYWLDMGTPEKYFSLNSHLLLNHAGPGSKNPSDGTYYGGKVKTASARISPPVIIGPGCHIGRSVDVTGPAIIGPNCHLEEGVKIENSILWDSTSIGKNTRLNRCIIGSNMTLKQNDILENFILTACGTKPLS
jgi:mannose-1-phosphate guanylyltransferase